MGRLITDPSFLSDVVLLLLGAALTGLLVPIVKSRLDSQGADRKQRLDAELARQGEFLRAQADLLASFSDETWTFLFAAFKVSYANAWEDAETHEEVWDAYVPTSWTHLGRIRAIISKAKRLVGKDCYRVLIGSYDWLIQYDEELTDYVEEGHTAEEWQAFHKSRFSEAATRTDQVIESLAAELRLSAGSEPLPPDKKRRRRPRATSRG